MRSQSALLASLEYWFCVLDVCFISASELSSESRKIGNELRMMSKIFTSYIPTDPACAILINEESSNYEYVQGRDITHDFLRLIAQYCRESYSNSKNSAVEAAKSRKTSAKDPLKRNFLDTDIFKYLVTMEACVDSLYSNVLYTPISSDNFNKMAARNRPPANIVSKYSLKSPNAGKNTLPEVETLDQRTNMLTAAKNRLIIYKNHAPNTHLAYLMLLRKFISAFAWDERKRLEHIFTLTNEERRIYKTEQLGNHETFEMKTKRLSLANLHASIRMESKRRYETMMRTLLIRLFSDYLDFCCTKNGIVAETRIKDILKHQETVSDDFINYRRMQFGNIIAQSEKWLLPYELYVYTYPWPINRRKQVERYSTSENDQISSSGGGGSYPAAATTTPIKASICLSKNNTFK